MSTLPPLARRFVAVFAGIVLGGLVVALVEGVNVVLFPPPEGLDYRDPAALGRYMAGLPPAAFAVVGLAWNLGALAGGAVAGRIAPLHAAVNGLAVGAMLAGASVMNLVDPDLPHPPWMWLAALLPVPVARYAARWVGARRGATVRADGG